MRIGAACHDEKSSTRDREPIRLDSASDFHGITSALRRAFSEAAAEPTTRDFEDLLHKLN
jgi:hypothetical protein